MQARHTMASAARRGALGGLALAACLGLFAGAATAQPPDAAGGPGGRRFDRRHGPPPFEQVLERHAERLGLDDAARARVRAIADAARPEGDRLRNELEDRQREMRELLGADAPDEAAVLAQADRIGAAETALQKQRLRTMLEIRAILTPEQRAELVKIHAERKERWRERKMRGGRDAGPPGPPPDDDAGEAPPPPEG